MHGTLCKCTEQMRAINYYVISGQISDFPLLRLQIPKYGRSAACGGSVCNAQVAFNAGSEVLSVAKFMQHPLVSWAMCCAREYANFEI